MLKKCIGPIEPQESGAYKFEYVWHTDIVEYSKLLSVKIQFMDNTIRTVQNADSFRLPYRIKDNIKRLDRFDKYAEASYDFLVEKGYVK